jgi:very-short-patch-repair endonuclease
MPVNNIVVGQKIYRGMQERARELRHDMTLAEKVLWQELRTDKLNGLHFRRQQIIDGYIVDFYCHAANLIVEVDGDIHNQRMEYDAERDAHLISRGFNVLRFQNDEVMNNLPAVLEKILCTCQSSDSPFFLIGKGPGDRSGEPK